MAALINRKRRLRSISTSCGVTDSENYARLQLFLDSKAFKHALNNMRIFTDIDEASLMTVELPNASTLTSTN